jgi:adenylate cyclase
VAQEIEHKYLVQSEAWRKQARYGGHYRQGYLSTDLERSVRVRVSGDKAVLTIKSSGGGDRNGLQRAEFEYPIPVADANQILDHLCRQPLIEKTRFRISQNGNTWEVDKFEKENDGLVIAELEISKVNRSPAHLPSWIGEEVSSDDRYSNANLVEHPYSEWRPGHERPDPKYHWKAGESVADGLKRVIAEQLQLAIWELSADQCLRCAR